MYSGYRAKQFKYRLIAYLDWYCQVIRKSLKYLKDEFNNINIYKVEKKSPTETFVSFENLIDEIKKQLGNG